MASVTAQQPGTSNQGSGLKSRQVILEKLKGSAKKLLEADENVARWHTNLTHSSQLTANSRIRRLSMFYKNTEITHHHHHHHHHHHDGLDWKGKQHEGVQLVLRCTNVHVLIVTGSAPKQGRITCTYYYNKQAISSTFFVPKTIHTGHKGDNIVDIYMDDQKDLLKCDKRSGININEYVLRCPI